MLKLNKTIVNPNPIKGLINISTLIPICKKNIKSGIIL